MVCVVNRSPGTDKISFFQGVKNKVRLTDPNIAAKKISMFGITKHKLIHNLRYVNH